MCVISYSSFRLRFRSFWGRVDVRRILATLVSLVGVEDSKEVGRMPAHLCLVRGLCFHMANRAEIPLRRACTASPTIQTRNRIEAIPRRLDIEPSAPSVATGHGRGVPAMVASCANLIPFSHLGDLLASRMRRLYFFSNRSCCWWLSSLKFGGQTFRALYGFAAALNGTCFASGSLADWAMRLRRVGNMMPKV